jgi:quinol monooxygenase YgiN
MSSVSLPAAGAGVLVATIASAVLLTRCFRAPRPDRIAWSIAMLGLLVSLGAQVRGYLAGFGPGLFRAMEFGGQLIAPLAMAIALSEVAGRSLGARFCARLYIGAVAVVAGLVLIMDQLSRAKFTKNWPDPATYYGDPARYALMAVGLVTVVIAVAAAVTSMRRSGRPGWDAVLSAQLAGVAAALLLAYPPMVLLLNSFGRGHSLPVHQVFAVLCAVAAGLAWYAGVGTGRVRVAALHGRDARAEDQGQREAAGDRRPGQPGRTRAFAGADEFGPGDGEFGRAAFEPGGSPVGRMAGPDRDLPPDLASAAGLGSGRDVGHTDDLDHTGDFDQFPPDDDAAFGWQTRGDRYPAREEPDGAAEDDGEIKTGAFDRVLANADLPSADRGWTERPAAPDPPRADLYGQIAIFTLLEDRVGEFDQLAERLVERVRATEPDTLVFIVHAVPSAPLQRILYEVYRDRDAYEWHRQQPYVTHFEADRRPYVLATNVIELGLQQAKVSPFPSVSDLFGEPGYDTSGFERPDYLRDYGRPSPRGAPREERAW